MNQSQYQGTSPVSPGTACTVALAVVHLGRTRRALIGGSKDARITQARGHVDLAQRLLERVLNDNLPDFEDGLPSGDADRTDDTFDMSTASGHAQGLSLPFVPNLMSTPKSRSLPSNQKLQGQKPLISSNQRGPLDPSSANQQRPGTAPPPGTNQKPGNPPTTNQNKLGACQLPTGNDATVKMVCPYCQAEVQALLNTNSLNSGSDETEIKVGAKFVLNGQPVNDGPDLRCPKCQRLVELQLDVAPGANDLFKCQTSLIVPMSQPPCGGSLVKSARPACPAPNSNTAAVPPDSNTAAVPPNPNTAAVPPKSPTATTDRPQVVTSMVCPTCNFVFSTPIEVGATYFGQGEANLSLQPKTTDGGQGQGQMVKCPQCLNSATLEPIVELGSSDTFSIAMQLTPNNPAVCGGQFQNFDQNPPGPNSFVPNSGAQNSYAPFAPEPNSFVPNSYAPIVPGPNSFAPAPSLPSAFASFSPAPNSPDLIGWNSMPPLSPIGPPPNLAFRQTPPDLLRSFPEMTSPGFSIAPLQPDNQQVLNSTFSPNSPIFNFPQNSPPPPCDRPN